jgi:DNA adenine methylase
LEFGFATFFLNRTNRSGVIKGGVIGGQEQQGDYLIDCRYPKPGLVDKIRRIARYRNAIELFQMDGEDFLSHLAGNRPRLFFFVDPPVELIA